MAWTTHRPFQAGFYWIIPVDPADRLSSVMEPVELYFDGKWSVLRTGDTKRLTFDQILYWWETPLSEPDR
jgi:hypothetical protein